MVQDKLLQRAMFSRFNQPWQVGLAIALGLTLGLMPKFNLLMIPLALAIFTAPISLGLCLMVAVPAMLLSTQLTAIENSLGTFLLSLPGLRSTWNWMYAQPLLRATRFYNSQELGSLLFAISSFYPVYLTATTFLQRNRKLDELDQITGDATVRSSQSILSPLPLDSKTPSPGRIVPRQVHSRSSIATASSVETPRTSDSVASFVVTQPNGMIAKTPMTNAGQADFNSSKPAEKGAADELVTKPPVDSPSSAINTEIIQTAETESTVREIDEQQWVLDTLIEIIRIRDDQLNVDDNRPFDNKTASITDAEKRLTETQQPSTVLGNKALNISEAKTIGDITNKPQVNLSAAAITTAKPSESSPNLDSQLSNNKLQMDRITSGTPMETISRMDKNTTMDTEANLFSKERKDKLIAAASTIANMLPPTSRPRPIASRDESLKYLIHHLQSLERESKE